MQNSTRPFKKETTLLNVFHKIEKVQISFKKPASESDI